MLLICELLNLFIGLKEGEIETFLTRFGVAIDRGQLRRYLFILEQLKYIQKVSRGHNHYYASKRSESFVSFGIPTTTFDRKRSKFQIAAYYRQHDRTRHTALAPFLSELGE